MNPLRWDVLLVGFVLAVPVLGLYLRGDLTAEETMNRVLWCLAAGWGVVALRAMLGLEGGFGMVAVSGGPPAEEDSPEGFVLARAVDMAAYHSACRVVLEYKLVAFVQEPGDARRPSRCLG